jgi:hypothetical protein
VPRADRDAVQAAARAAALVVVVAWLFVDDVRAWLPIWLPLVLLGATELEFVLRGRGQLPGRRRVAGRPGPEDADLGFGEFVEEEDGYRYVPPPPRPPRGGGRRVGWLVGGAVAAVLVALAVRSDRAATWQGLSEDDRARAEARFQGEARRIAGRPVRVRCDDGYAFTGAGSDTLGVAFPARALAYLDPTVCRSLRDVAEGRERGERGIDAVVVLAHEAVHLRGERREGVTECLALQEAAPLATRLGLAEERARALVRAAYERRLAERNVIRAAYALPTSCREDGALDRSPGDGRFP